MMVRKIAIHLAKQLGDFAIKPLEQLRYHTAGQSLAPFLDQTIKASELSLGLADPLGFESHHLVAYTLLTFMEPSERELLTEMDFQEEHFEDLRAYSRGADADLIRAGQYDLELLLKD